MFARRLFLRLVSEHGSRPVPATWLEQFFLRDFTGYRAFDETLPAADGVLEAGFEVKDEIVRAEFEKWLRGRKMIAAGEALEVSPHP